MKLWSRIRYFGRRRSMERDLEEEMQAHRAMKEERLQREGMSAEEARATAARSFGNMTLALEDSRSIWNFAWLESLGQDIRYALRSFRSAPLFSLTVILTIGLALGLNTTLFSAFNTYVLAPFSVQDPYSLYSMWWNTKSTSGRGFSWDEFQHLLRNNPAFSDVVATRWVRARLNGETYETVRGQLFSGNYFSMLGVTPELGRVLLPSDTVAPGRNAVIVFSHDFWKAHLQEDPSVVGRTIDLQGRPFVIVGVARRGFSGISSLPPDFWVPMTVYGQLVDGPDLFGAANIHPLEITGHLNPNITLDQARASLLVNAKTLTVNYPPEDRVITVGLESDATSFPLTRDTIEGAIPSAVAFGLILLLACANVANIMLARAMARQREIGLRMALGAARPRLIRQLLTEGFVLAVPSAGLGFCVAWLGARAGLNGLFAILPPAFAAQLRIMPINLDWRVFLFILTAACVSTLAFALVPALQATRGGLIRATRGDFTSHHPTGRLRSALLTVQVAICVMLLISAGVLLRGGRRVELTDVGLDVRNVIEIDVRRDLHVKAAAILASDPSVESQTVAWHIPLYGTTHAVPVAPYDGASFIPADSNYVSPEYFGIFRIAITRGRNFTADEARAQAPLAIVSEATARAFWPHDDALGQTLRIQPPQLSQPTNGENASQYATARVIGVARDVVSGSIIRGVDRTCIYFPANAATAIDDALLVRVRGNPETVRRSLETKLSSAVPGAVTQMIPLNQLLDLQYFPFHAFSWISEALGALALLLTTIGIYGVIAYLVTQRSREIGIRIALGASSRTVIRLVLSQSIRLAAIGLAVGTLMALGVARLAARQFAILNVFAAPVYAVSIAVVLAVAALAAAIPARRAAKLDPMSILRHE
jgi:predicted permease